MSRHFGGTSHIRQSDRTRQLTLVALVAILVLCVVAAFAFLLLSRDSTESAQATVPAVAPMGADVKMVSVLVPVHDVGTGAALEPAMFRLEQRPSVGLSGGEIHDFEEVKGMFSRTQIVTGVPLHKELITNVKPTNEITAHIPPGFRAVTIRVDDRTSVEGFTRPGAKVDVVWAFKKNNGEPTVSTIVQNAKVLSAQGATNNNAENKAGVPNTVTLLVTELDANKIQLASTTGALSLSLRGDGDNVGGVGGSISIDQLMGGVQGDAVEPVDENFVEIGGQKFILKGKKLVPVP